MADVSMYMFLYKTSELVHAENSEYIFHCKLYYEKQRKKVKTERDGVKIGKKNEKTNMHLRCNLIYSQVI